MWKQESSPKMKNKISPKQIALSLVIKVFLIANIMFTACSAAEIAELDSALSKTEVTQGDFGDAPDDLATGYDSGNTGIFPTRQSSNGARHADVTKVALGWINDALEWPNTAEEGATDPNDPDGIQNIDEEPGESDNDDKDDGLLTYMYGDDEEATLEFAVSAASDSSQTTYYLNVLFDWNKDGEWKGLDSNGAEEWAVKNFVVTIAPGEEKTFRTDTFNTGTSAHPVWMRMTLSEVPIDETLYPDGWDGTGSFALGETEDYFLTSQKVLSLYDDETGEGIPGVPFGPFKPRPLPPIGGGGGGGGAGGGGGNVCEYNYMMSLSLCEGKSAHRLLTIGGFAPDSITASSSNSGVASVSLNEANVTITGNSEGSATIYIVATQGNCTYYMTITVEIKDCPPKKKLRIECCDAEDIRRDPSQCNNCTVVGRQMNQTNTFGGGGTIPETSMTGRKTNVSKSFVLHRGGGLVDVITVYYECKPCDEAVNQVAIDPDEDVTDEFEAWLDEIEEYYFSMLTHEEWGGENGTIDDWNEYDEMAAYYDSFYDEAFYECASRYFEEMYGEY
jgi:hypothetical protein